MMSLDEFWHFKVGRIANMKIMSNGLLNVDDSMVYCSRPISPGFLKKIFHATLIKQINITMKLLI